MISLEIIEGKEMRDSLLVEFAGADDGGAEYRWLVCRTLYVFLEIIPANLASFGSTKREHTLDNIMREEDAVRNIP